MLCLALFIIQSCSDSSPTSTGGGGNNEEQPTISVLMNGSAVPSNLNISHKAQVINFKIEATGGDWEYSISNGSGWLSEKNRSANSLSLSVKKNTGEERSATIKFNIVNHSSIKEVVKVIQAKGQQSNNLVVYYNFENINNDNRPKIKTRGKAKFQVVANPVKNNTNPSNMVGKFTTSNATWDFFWNKGGFGSRFDFSKGTTFTMLVYTSDPGNIYLKLQPQGSANPHAQVKYSEKIPANKWTKIEFHFKASAVQGKPYTKFDVLFHGKKKQPGTIWYIDNISGPPLKK